MQVRPLLPTRGIPWLLQLGMAPWRSHWCLCCAWCRQGAIAGERGCTSYFWCRPQIPRPNRATNRISLSRRSSYKFKGLTASQVLRLIGLLLVFASQKIVQNVQNEMAESIVPLREKIKDSLTRQGMWNIRGPHRKRIGRKGRKGKSTFF